jgi:pyrophosphatase PpaX
LDAVLFDLDGTLIDTTNAIVQSLRHTVWYFTGEKRDLDGFRKYLGITLDDAMRELVPSDPDAAREIYVEHNLARHEELVKAFPGAESTLKTLRKSAVRTAIVTSKRRNSAAVGLRITGLEGLFDAEVYYDDTERHKPDPEPILRALDLLGITEGKVLMVGDSIYDVRAAKNAQLVLDSIEIKSVGAAYGPSGREILLRELPDFLIADLAEILTISGISAG